MRKSGPAPGARRRHVTGGPCRDVRSRDHGPCRTCPVTHPGITPVRRPYRQPPGTAATLHAVRAGLFESAAIALSGPAPPPHSGTMPARRPGPCPHRTVAALHAVRAGLFESAATTPTGSAPPPHRGTVPARRPGRYPPRTAATLHEVRAGLFESAAMTPAGPVPPPRRGTVAARQPGRCPPRNVATLRGFRPHDSRAPPAPQVLPASGEPSAWRDNSRAGDGIIVPGGPPGSAPDSACRRRRTNRGGHGPAARQARARPT